MALRVSVILRGRAKVLARIERSHRRQNPGDVKPVGAAVSEGCWINYGPGLQGLL